MSPRERHDPKLTDLQLGQVPGGRPGPDGDGDEDIVARVEEELDEGLEPNEEEFEAALEEEEYEEFEEMEEHAAELKAAKEKGEKVPGPISRLYNGETSFDFVGKRKWWFLLSSIIIVAGLLSLGFRGLNLGIDFKGGSAWIVAAPGVSQTQAQSAVEAAGLTNPTVEILGAGSNEKIEVQADLNNLPADQQTAISNKVQGSLADLAHVSPAKRPALSEDLPRVGDTVVTVCCFSRTGSEPNCMARARFFAWVSLRFPEISPLPWKEVKLCWLGWMSGADWTTPSSSTASIWWKLFSATVSHSEEPELVRS